jgi:hypothetical protein
MVGNALATLFALRNVELMRSCAEMVWIQMAAKMLIDVYPAAKIMMEAFAIQYVLQCALKIKSNVMVQSKQMVARM